MNDERGKSPAFQFYPKDFLSDEKQIRMPLAAVGIYMRLICHCWNEGSLPTELTLLARMSGATVRQMKDLWPAIGPCFRTNDDGRLIHPRLEREREKQLTYRQRQSDRATARWEMQRKLDERPKEDATAMPRHELATASAMQALQCSSSSSAVCNLQTVVTQTDAPPMDQAFRKFQNSYPSERRQGGFMVEQAFLAAVTDIGGFDELMARLEQHKRSEQWLVKHMVPKMQRWLQEELWRAELPEPKPPSAAPADLTAKALERIQSDAVRYGVKR